jgi:hypothetical protein
VTVAVSNPQRRAAAAARPAAPDAWPVRYHSERVLLRAPSLVALAPLAGAHHERLDGSGYHRGTAAAGLSAQARLLAAADAYHAMTEPRAHRAACECNNAYAKIGASTRAGATVFATQHGLLAWGELPMAGASGHF